MKVLKFGGSSLASIERFRDVSRIVQQQSLQQPLIVVLSAPHGVTNSLLHLVTQAQSGALYQTELEQLRERLLHLVQQTQSIIDADVFSTLQAFAERHIEIISQYVQGISLLSTCPDSIQAKILGAGEQFSVQLMQALLQSMHIKTQVLDSTQFVKSQGDYLNAVADIPATQAAFATIDFSSDTRVWLMAGFVSSLPSGEQALLGRNGSDYSAAIIAAGVRASACEIWTDVDGVYSADPRQVKNAKLIEQLSYAEAMELSYFGAKVLHPKTIGPLAQAGIPCTIKNTLNPGAPGSCIGPESNADLVKGISSLENLALITVSGPGLKVW